MESLGSLNASLPPNQQAEEQLGLAFRSAALALTGLFKQGKKASSKAYLAGQKQAFQEVLEFIQASLDQPQASTSANGFAGLAGAPQGALDVARLINFVCARQEAIKAEEEDHDEDEPIAPAPAPRRAASAAPAPAPPSPLRPGLLHRAASAAAPSPRPASAAPTANSQSHRHSHPVASTSSAPASPPSSTFSPPFSRPALFPSSTTSGGFAAPASPSPLGPSSTSATAPHTASQHSFSIGSTSNNGAPPSRPSSHSRSLRSRNSHRGGGGGGGGGSSTAGKSGASTPASVAGGTIVGAEEVDLNLFGTGMKRRWAAAAAGHQTTAAPADVEFPAGNGGAESREGGMDVESMMDMEGWDGVGERPYKRATRTVRGSLAVSPQPEGGEGR
ncbi:hypothetical protein JCM11641_007909 [Rhodosporidiobolus odoratus]